MDFGVIKTFVEVVKEGAFGGTYFRDISSVNEKWYFFSWTELDQLKNIDQKYFFSGYYELRVNKYDIKYGTPSRLWENKG